MKLIGKNIYGKQLKKYILKMKRSRIISSVQYIWILLTMGMKVRVKVIAPVASPLQPFFSVIDACRIPPRDREREKREKRERKERKERTERERREIWGRTLTHS